MMQLLKMKRFWAVLLIPFTMILLWAAEGRSDLVERFYSRAIYPVLAGIFGRVFGVFPFSVAEFVVVVVIILSVYFLARFIRRIYIHKENRKKLLTVFVANLCCILGVGLFAFAITSGLNYQRISFAEQSGFDVRPSPVEELVALSIELAESANAARQMVAEDERGVMRLSAPGYHALALEAQELFGDATQRYPNLGDGYVPRPKPMIFSRAMSWMNIGGVYFPFTFEANVNVDKPHYSIPATMMHELAHFRGFMREDEANFLAYLTSRDSGNPDFVYSGYMMALIHTTNALFSVDRNAYWDVIGKLYDGVLRDMTASSEYWRQFEGPAATVAVMVNDAYLRANNQASGVRSYGEMVDLLLAERRARPPS